MSNQLYRGLYGLLLTINTEEDACCNSNKFLHFVESNMDELQTFEMWNEIAKFVDNHYKTLDSMSVAEKFMKQLQIMFNILSCRNSK